MGEAAIR